MLKLKKGVLRLVLGKPKYDRFMEEIAEHNYIPENVLDRRMIERTDIHEHLATLNMLIVTHKLRNILELGTGVGESTIALLEAAKKIGGVVHSVDIQPCPDAHKKIVGAGLANYWRFLQSDSLKLDWTQRIEFLLVDTWHTKEHALMELKKYEPFVVEGGIVALHDIVTWPGVMEAVREYTKNRTDLTVYKYLNNNGLAVIFKEGLLK